MRKKGFTLIELLVVVSIIAMLLAILMPALSKVKKIAMRVVCATNLKGLGTAEVVYSQDYDDQYAVQGRGGAHQWSNLTNSWENPNKNWSTSGTITVGASLYLLVREADVTPKSFVCPSSDQTEWNQQTAAAGATNPPDIVEVWDFGAVGFNNQGPENCVSYAYHNPYDFSATNNGTVGVFAPDGTRSASFAIMGDKNPYFSELLTNGGAPTADNWDTMVTRVNLSATAQSYQIDVQNSYPHDRDGQNIMFADGHVEYAGRADVGAREDGVYTQWATNTSPTEADIRQGLFPSSITSFQPQSKDDTVLINDSAVADFN